MILELGLESDLYHRYAINPLQNHLHKPDGMHLHLDPVGGIAGDMFAAALIDLRPELASEHQKMLNAADFSSHIRVYSEGHRDHTLTGHRFRVQELMTDSDYSHRSYRKIRMLLENSRLTPTVTERSLAMFELLAGAEGQVHGIPVDEVSFHEVGAWDSIVDIVTAAWLIERFNEASWSCAALPLGSGRVSSAHGNLPVPAPATTLLLEGYPVFQDGIPGERITPTGAAILRHLNPSFEPMRNAIRLTGCGTGFGSRRLEGTSNVLRVLAFEKLRTVPAAQQLFVCQFEVDDQTPEDLSVALDNLRNLEGIVDVVQAPVVGKKGRLAAQVQLLARPEALDVTLERCFAETSTLGVRWHSVRRSVLERDVSTSHVDGRSVRVKSARRPDGIITGKAEMDDLALKADGLAGREGLRREAEAMALKILAARDRGKADA